MYGMLGFLVGAKDGARLPRFAPKWGVTMPQVHGTPLVEAMLSRLKVTSAGLSQTEADERLRRYGANALRQVRRLALS